MNCLKARKSLIKLSKTHLAELIKQTASIDFSIDQITNLMFKSIVKNDAHFHLSYKGFQLMKYVKFKSYKIKLKDKLTWKGILNLSRECPCPWYISKKKDYVYLYAEKPAVILQMLDGDLSNFRL